ncbi:MAG: hypothetical protein ACFB20_01265 [Opitutales bacterium]
MKSLFVCVGGVGPWVRCAACFWLLGLGLAPVESSARIGDTVGRFEQRLFNEGGGTRYTRHFLRAKLDDPVPPIQMREYFPQGHEVRVYYKKDYRKEANSQDLDDGENPPGWDIYVVFVGGRSVMETYRRNGSAMTEHELNGLLHVQRGTSVWVRKEGEEVLPSELGYDFLREDGELRAVKGSGQVRNALTFYLVDLDEMILRQRDQERAQAEEEAQEKAPASISGF